MEPNETPSTANWQRTEFEIVRVGRLILKLDDNILIKNEKTEAYSGERSRPRYLDSTRRCAEWVLKRVWQRLEWIVQTPLRNRIASFVRTGHAEFLLIQYHARNSGSITIFTDCYSRALQLFTYFGHAWLILPRSSCTCSQKIKNMNFYTSCASLRVSLAKKKRGISSCGQPTIFTVLTVHRQWVPVPRCFRGECCIWRNF